MSWAIPSDTHAAGDTGHITDHNNAADVLTDLNAAARGLYTAAAGATAETFSRYLISTGSAALTTQILYVTAIGLHQNTVVSNITMATKGTAAGTITHGWYVLLDNTYTARAVTADQAALTTWQATNTPYTLATGNFTTSYSGLYYVGIMVQSATTPVMCVANGASATPTNVLNIAPILCGSSSTGQTTPPAVGAAMTAPTAAGGYDFWAYLS